MWPKVLNTIQLQTKFPKIYFRLKQLAKYQDALRSSEWQIFVYLNLLVTISDTLNSGN